MKVTIETSIIGNGVPRWEDEIRTVDPAVVVTGAEGLTNFSKISPAAADACIYCGSNEYGRTREHVIAYALGGDVTIPKGSCRACQKITHKFETAVLRGPMQMVRYIQRLPSRTKHQEAPQIVSLFVTINGIETTVDVPADKAPILLAFPTFEAPSYLHGGSSNLRLNGLVTGSYGVDPESFVRGLGAESMRLTSPGNAPVAFAQMVAKTAYANAYIQKQLHRVKDTNPLVRAMLYEPNSIGRFVGTLPEPYLKREGVQHYLGIHELSAERVLYATVQLFAGSGAPIYVVVLGDLRDVDTQQIVASDI